MKKVYGYTRVSSLGQALDGDSLSAQEEKIKAYCTLKNLDLLQVFREEGVSGGIELSERPQFKILQANLEGKKGTGIVITKLDRLSRSSKDFINFMADIKDKYDFYCISNDIDTSSPQGKFTMVLLSAIAELEKDMTSERVKEIIALKKSKGERTGTIPFGKNLVVGTKLLEDDEDEQRTIMIAKDLRKQIRTKNGKSKPMTYKEICEQLIKDGRKNKDGQVSWYPTQIRRMLNDGIYVVHKGKNKK